MTQWYFNQDGKEVGPVSNRQLVELAERGHLTLNTLVRRSDMTTPIPAQDVKEFRQAIGEVSEPLNGMQEQLPEVHSNQSYTRPKHGVLIFGIICVFCTTVIICTFIVVQFGGKGSSSGDALTGSRTAVRAKDTQVPTARGGIPSDTDSSNDHSQTSSLSANSTESNRKTSQAANASEKRIDKSSTRNMVSVLCKRSVNPPSLA